MEKVLENINFNNNPGKVLIEKQIEKNISSFFSIYTLLDKNTIPNIETINSVLNQTYKNFNWIFFGKKIYLNKFKKFLKENNIIDSRILLIEKECLDLENLSNYLIPIDFESYIDKTLLETFYSFIMYYGTVGVIYTNCIDIANKKTYNESIISIPKRLISFPVKSFCYNKKIANYIKRNENNTYHFESDLCVIHFNFYGVWHKNVIENRIKLKYCNFYNFPDSSNYTYDTIPKNEPIQIGKVKKNKNILCMMPWYKVGGADLFNYNIFKYLKSKGYKIYVITTEVCNYEARLSVESVVDAYYDLTTFLRRHDWANFIKSLIISKNIDLVIQLSSMYGYYLIPWLKYQFPNLPIVDYLHAENYAWRNGGYPRDSVAIADYLDKTYCCNNHLEKLLYEEMKRKVHNTKTMYIGVDTEKFNPDLVNITDKEIKKRCNGKKVILFPSRFGLEKRPIFLLKIIERLSKKRNDFVCLMIGDGEAKKMILDYIKSKKLEDYVIILSFRDDIRQYYKIANLTLICSLSEGITLTTYESLSMNTPVISSDVGGQKEIINNKVGAIIKTFQENKKEELYNFNYDEEELKLYEESILKIFDNEKEYTKDNLCRNYIINNYSIKKIFQNFEKEVLYYMKNGSKISSKNLTNEMFAIQYLVLFNETTKVYYNNSLNFENFKNAMRDKIYRQNKLWQHWWWRFFVKTAKKLKVDVLLKKTIFKNR